ncbi:MAG: hypothetical protein J4F42_05750 [Desulfurellaceae bacterium]|nr:hypothetical protein [Desulfurellaceae bacterium]
MATSDVTHTPAVSRPSATGLTTFAQEGMVAGLLGAVTIAVWFLVVDSLSGRPLYTPTVLGLALFQGTAGLASSVAIDLEMVLMFTWVHGLVFMAIGGLVSYLLDLAEHHPHVGFGVVLLFVVLELGFVVVSLVFAEPVLRALAWSAVLVGNLFAAVVMVGYFWRHHPRLTIEP